MSRRIFGTWGLSLSDEDFARALAICGVLEKSVDGSMFLRRSPESLFSMLRQQIEEQVKEGRSNWPILAWRLPYPGRMQRDSEYRSPEKLAELISIWEMVSQLKPIRLEVQPDTRGQSILPWIIEQLALPAVGVASVYSRFDQASAASWTWPLETGLLADSESLQLHKKLEQRYWEELSTVELLTKDLEVCELLLLPGSLRESLARLLSLSSPIRATLVIVLGGMTEKWSNAGVLKDALLNESGATGIYVTDIPVDKQFDWYNSLIEELSHNKPLDVALQIAARRVSRPSYFFATSQLLKESNLVKVLSRIRDQIAELSDKEIIDLPTRSAEMLNLPYGDNKPSVIFESLRSGAADFRFDSESGEATAISELSRSAREVIEPAEARAQPPRLIQVQVFEEKMEFPEKILVKNVLRPQTEYSLDVFVGPVDSATDSLKAPDVFPEEELPPEKAEHLLTVVFSEPHHAPVAQTANIRLPMKGRSTMCRFYFRTAEEVEDFEARIILLHENRVLQTALLRAMVVQDPREVPEEEYLSLEMEAVINNALSGLEQRRHFDAAFVFNRSGDGKPRGTAVMGETAILFPVEGFNIVKERLDSKLAEIAARPTSFPRDLGAPETEKLLLYLAFQGRSLFQELVKDQIGAESSFRNAERIQILSVSPESFMPLEFIYDFPAPKPSAKLCPNAKKALEVGECMECKNKTAGEEIYVCPLGFWGLSRVIERHIDKKNVDLKTPLRPSEYALKSVPTSIRKKLNPFATAIFASSEKVDNFRDEGSQLKQSERVVKSLSNVFKENVVQVNTWDKWMDGIKMRKPSLLVLMPHTESLFDQPLMEIGADEQLHVQNVDSMHVLSEGSPPPVVFLLGCETMKGIYAEIPFQSLVVPFRAKGAAIVLATRTKIRGRHSIPVFEKMVEIMNGLADDEAKSFGDVMLKLRREALADGLPTVLCLFAYGDADWQIVKS